MGDPELIDEIIENPVGVQLIIHMLRDWRTDGVAAATETRAKLTACVECMRSDEFREEFAGRPGMIVLKSTFAPPDDIQLELAQLGAEIKVGAIYLDGSVTCSLCGKGGFTDAQGSITDQGWACLRCFDQWSTRQEESYKDRLGLRAHDRAFRFLKFSLLAVVAIVALIRLAYAVMALGPQ